MLARRQEALDDLAVQVVGDDDAHGIDIGRVGDRAPVVLGPFVAVALGGVVGDGGVRIRDRDQPDIGRSVPNKVVAVRYPAACARPAIPPPITATPMESSVSHRAKSYCVIGVLNRSIRPV